MPRLERSKSFNNLQNSSQPRNDLKRSKSSDDVKSQSARSDSPTEQMRREKPWLFESPDKSSDHSNDRNSDELRKPGWYFEHYRGKRAFLPDLHGKEDWKRLKTLMKEENLTKDDILQMIDYHSRGKDWSTNGWEITERVVDPSFQLKRQEFFHREKETQEYLLAINSKQTLADMAQLEADYNRTKLCKFLAEGNDIKWNNDAKIEEKKEAIKSLKNAIDWHIRSKAAISVLAAKYRDMGKEVYIQEFVSKSIKNIESTVKIVEEVFPEYQYKLLQKTADARDMQYLANKYQGDTSQLIDDFHENRPLKKEKGSNKTIADIISGYDSFFARELENFRNAGGQTSTNENKPLLQSLQETLETYFSIRKEANNNEIVSETKHFWLREQGVAITD